MKFFFKLFLSMVFILTLALSIVEYFTVSFSLQNSFSREQSSALAQHQMVKYSIRAALSSSNDEGLLRLTAPAAAKSAEELMEDRDSIYLGDENGIVYHSTLSVDTTVALADDGVIEYYVENGKNNEKLFMTVSSFEQGQVRFIFATQRDISTVFIEAETLQKSCMRIYLLVLGGTTAVMLLISWTLTRPITELRRSSVALAAGDYKARAIVHSKDEVGELATAYNMMADTIEHKIDELEIARQRQEDFTANFAHELKTPMTSIIGYADTIYQKDLTREQVKQAAWYIVNEGMRLEALSFKLMELLTIEKENFELEQAMIDEVLNDAIQSAEASAAKRGIKLLIRCESGWVRIEYDLFKTLLLNLLDNAMKSGATYVLLKGNLCDGEYVISVTDNGRGIPEDELERISEPFYMVDKSRSRREHGAGLGLSLAAKIAAIHGTKLEYKSRLGEGTCVKFRLKSENDDV